MRKVSHAQEKYKERHTSTMDHDGWGMDGCDLRPCPIWHEDNYDIESTEEW